MTKFLFYSTILLKKQGGIFINGVIFAASQATVLLFMAIMFFAAMLKKNKRKNQKILIALVLLISTSLILEILLTLSNYGYIDGYNPSALVLSQYVIALATVIGTHYYVLENTNEYVKVKKVLFFTPIIYIFPFIALPLIFDRSELIYHFENCAILKPNILGWALLFAMLFGLITDFIITLVFLRKVKFKNSIMLICYELLPAFTVTLDYRYNTSFVYTVIALLLLIDYIILGARQDILIAQQRQHMAEQQEKLAIEQTKITISQIQPHFLYNVISSIMVCCKTDSEKAVVALADFSDYLRQNMRSLQCSEVVPFSKELEHIETYLRLEKLRFENRLEIEYDIEEKNFSLPALSIQPLVENAVKHGIGQRMEGGKITVRTHRVKNGVIVLVIDNGVGFFIPQDGLNLEGDHIGLKNVTSRIEKMCHGTLDIESFLNKGTTVTVFIPDNK